jgi:CheY-like chemotaxis protein/tetratricopeptide (TPR) repeat protein
LAPTILCADDDRNLCQILTRALVGAGYRVETAHDGEAALERVRALRPDLVTLDVLLPKRDGFAVLEAIRRDPELRSTPVFLLSGCTLTEAYRRRAESLRADALLVKPVPLAELLEVVGKQLDSGQGARRGARAGASVQLSGRLEEMPVPALLHHLHGLRATGVLEVASGKKKKQIQLRDGHPEAVRSNLVNETLGHLLVASGKISWDAMHESIARVKRGEGLQGQILVAMHMLDEADLAAALRNQADEKLFEAFAWTQGSYRFHRGARVKRANALTLKRGPADLILEGVRRRAPLALVEEFLADRAARYPVPGESPFYRFQELELDASAQALLARLDGSRRIADVEPLDEPTRRTLYGLLALEMLELRDAPAAAPRRAAAEPVRPAPRASRPLVETRRAPLTHAGAEPEAPGPDPHAKLRSELAGLAASFRERDFFGILGVAEGATDEEIRHAYTALAKRTHPDRFAGCGDAVIRLAEEVFGLVSRAYETIGERDQRLAHLRDRSSRARDEAELEEGHRALRAELEFQKGEAALRARRYDVAAEHFKAAVDAYPEEGEYRAFYGWAHYLRDPEAPGRLRDALEHVLQGRKLAPDREKPYLFLGRLYKAAGRDRMAEKMFTRAVQLDPDCLEALRELRLIHMRRERSRGLVRRFLRR